jgi:hypothetical protein
MYIFYVLGVGIIFMFWVLGLFLCSGCWDYFYVLGVGIIFMFWVLGLFEWNVWCTSHIFPAISRRTNFMRRKPELGTNQRVDI